MLLRKAKQDVMATNHVMKIQHFYKKVLLLKIDQNGKLLSAKAEWEIIIEILLQS